MGYIKKQRATICETCGETNQDKLLAFKPICYSCKKAPIRQKFTMCDTCGETDKNKLRVFTPICCNCYDKKYRKPKGPRKEPKIKIHVPDGVGDPLKYYKTEYSKIYHERNKKRTLYHKRVITLKKYVGILNKDINDYLKDNISLEDLKNINQNLIKEYRDIKKAEKEISKAKKIIDPEFYTENFKNKLHGIFGDRITLAGTYINKETKTILSCKEHGEFEFTPDNLKKLKKPYQPCQSCRLETLNSDYTENFKNKLHGIFGDGITLVGAYTNRATKTTLSCKEHGEFEFIPGNIQEVKYPCPYCRLEYGFNQSEISQDTIVKGLNNEELIQKSIEMYGDKYDYSKFKYVNKKHKVIFICKEHGEFEQKYESHIMGFQGCKKCAPHDKQFFSEKMLSHKLYLNLREHITRSLKHLGVEYKKYDPNYSSIKICGLKKEDFLRYLETKMEPWMTWSNYGLYNGTPNHGWDLDHIIPRNTVTTLDDFYKVYHYTNIQPLCSYINRDIKKDKILK